ncbi:diacylglycerol kinase family protein [Sporosarcina sp. YIM B06819]|uniref:diacylglycerol kinase family protein n=1 Tax=Sporosarcina sp. YIM B06819 TaxID=3081769 RepID=UPI00298D50E3|nr:diacylglycerol kinase family protein [Sporosarcina sp. YIM B06819]
MRKFFKAFNYAWSGILYGVKAERNVKFHLLATVVVMLAGLITGLSVLEWCIVLLLIGGMLALEMMNAAIERVVDLVTTESHPLAKYAKDLAAGAVLIYAMISAVIGWLIFVPKWFN